VAPARPHRIKEAPERAVPEAGQRGMRGVAVDEVSDQCPDWVEVLEEVPEGAVVFVAGSIGAVTKVPWHIIWIVCVLWRNAPFGVAVLICSRHRHRSILQRDFVASYHWDQGTIRLASTD